jgi:hypothetical protein
VSELILHQSEGVFRNSISSINKGIYSRLKELLKKILKLQKRNPGVKTEELCMHSAFSSSESKIVINSANIFQV